MINESNGCKENPPSINPSPNYGDNNECTGEDDVIMVDLDLCMDGDKKDEFSQGNDLASHHLSELNCITVDGAKAVNLDLHKNDNVEYDFPKRNDLGACDADKKFSAGEDDTPKANLNLHNDDNENDDESSLSDPELCPIKDFVEPESVFFEEFFPLASQCSPSFAISVRPPVQ